MATGEYDFNGHFHLSPGGGSEDQPELPFLHVTVVIWIVFIAVMPILLINMLVCGICINSNTENSYLSCTTVVQRLNPTWDYNWGSTNTSFSQYLYGNMCIRLMCVLPWKIEPWCCLVYP